VTEVNAMTRFPRRAPLLVALYVLLVAACAPSAVTPVQSADDLNINGYGKTTWGMTPDQVLKAEAPGAKKLDKPERTGDLTGAIVVDGIQFGTDKFTALFSFDDDLRLQEVVVKCLEQDNLQANALTFSFLEKLFTEKYGSPTRRERSSRPRVFWELPNTTIRLVHFTAFEGRISRVNFSYMPRGRGRE